MSIKLKLSHQLLLLVIVPVVVFELIIGFLLYSNLHTSGEEFAREAHARLLLKKVNAIRTEFLWAYEAGNEIVMTQGAALNMFSVYNRHTAQAAALIEDLAGHCKGDAEAEKAVARVRSLSNQTRYYTDMFLKAFANGDTTIFFRYGGRVRQLPVQAGETLNEMIERQLALLDQYGEKKAKEREQQSRLVLLLVFATGTLICGLAAALSLRISKRFDVLIDNAQRLAAGQQLNPPLKGESELELLDREFRRMSQELENTLRKQRVIIDYAADVICSVNATLAFSEVSTASVSVWGYEPDELLGKRIVSIVQPEDAAKTAEVFESAQNKPVDSFENRMVRKDGSVVDTRWSLRYVEQEKSLVCVAHDISQRKELERMKQEFVAIVSHDLRSPLTSINMRLGTLAGGMHGELPSDALRIISGMEASVGRLIRLINDLLDVEKLESGAWDMHYQKKSLLATMEVAADSLLALSEKKHVEIVLPSTDIDVEADHERLTQVIANIVSNAIKFSAENSQVVLTQESIDGMLEVRISDSGPGILEEERKLVFDRFRQSKRDIGKQSGSGLGLAICAAIIKEHGGTIGVDSNNGKGSTFWFRIPMLRKENLL